MSRLTLVVCTTAKHGIGQNGTMPWHIPKDLAYFKQVTTKAPATQLNAIVMGRATWESIPNEFKPLKNRINIVLSRNKNYALFPEGKPRSAGSTRLFSDLNSALYDCSSQEKLHRLFIIGGAHVYKEALGLGSQSSNSLLRRADRILMTRLFSPEYDCDVFFPDVLGGAEWRRASREEHSAWVGFDVPAGIQTENGVEFEFQMWVRSPDQEDMRGGDP